MDLTWWAATIIRYGPGPDRTPPRPTPRSEEAGGNERRHARQAVIDHGQRPLDQVRELRQQAEKSCTVCADCFQSIPAGASITIVGRPIHYPAADHVPIFGSVPARDVWIGVSICLTCWLISIRNHGVDWAHYNHNAHRSERFMVREIERFRCEGCSRPMRRNRPQSWRRQLHHTERVCCDDCRHIMVNRRASERRRVRHEQITCIVCDKTFVPTRSDAFCCGNTCRQAAHRQRHKRT
jgi:hypothetical protein